MLSALDKAYLEGQENSELEENFYELFLNSVLYVPVYDVLEPQGETVLEEPMEISPVILEDEGRTWLMLFDSEERLNEWADGQEIGIIGMQGIDVLNNFGAQHHMMLNVASDHMKEFWPDEIEWLLSNIAENK